MRKVGSAVRPRVATEARWWLPWGYPEVASSRSAGQSPLKNAWNLARREAGGAACEARTTRVSTPVRRLFLKGQHTLQLPTGRIAEPVAVGRARRLAECERGRRAAEGLQRHRTGQGPQVLRVGAVPASPRIVFAEKVRQETPRHSGGLLLSPLLPLLLLLELELDGHHPRPDRWSAPEFSNLESLAWVMGLPDL